MTSSDGPTARVALAAAGAVAVAMGVVILAIVLRVWAAPPLIPTTPERLLAPLIALAACLVASLMVRRAPGVAWAASVGAIGIAALEIVSLVRAWQGFAGTAAWPWMVLLAEVVLITGVTIAAGHAGHRRAEGGASGSRYLRWLASAGVAAAVLGAAWAMIVAIGETSARSSATDLVPIRTTARIALALIAAGLLVGIGRDLAGPAARARARMRAESGSGTNRRSLVEFARLVVDEAFPGGAASRRDAVEAERARLAADLHAVLLPNLRQAAATAAGTSTSPDLAATLKTAVDDVEQLMHGRQSIVLEEFGLVAALEWLAERTEDRSPVRVVIDLEGEVDRAAGLPLPVRRSAFRVALLAVDNVVRHAGATRLDISLRVVDGRLRLAIEDDGVGAQPSEGAGRGLRDMREEARAAGGTLEVGTAGGGTRIELTLPVRTIAGPPATQQGNVPTGEAASPT